MISGRREFVRHSAAVALGFSGLQRLFGGTGCAERLNPDMIVDGYGDLIPDPNGIIDLPDGFNYQVVSRFGDEMTDGLILPGRPDGMAAFPGPDGKTIVVRNHELSPQQPQLGAFGAQNERLTDAIKELHYDAGTGSGPCHGGTTTFVYDTKTMALESQFLSLAGTVRNCAGGPTPWGTWITCEESVIRKSSVCSVDHGYNFEVPVTVDPAIAKPVPLKAMGRFNHEAVAVDPDKGEVYQTEDDGEGCIYRFIPNVGGMLAAGGKLQALVVEGRPTLDTRNWGREDVKTRETMRAVWIDLDNVESPDNDLRYRAQDQGAAIFARGEGMWYGGGAIYFACTNGGPDKNGQIWKYTPEPSGIGGELELFVQAADSGLLNNADNLTVAPWGDLVVCEDGSGDQFVVGVTPEGKLYRFARNAVSGSEFAGSCFSPDGSVLFVNIQIDGLTLAVTGPWKTS